MKLKHVAERAIKQALNHNVNHSLEHDIEHASEHNVEHSLSRFRQKNTKIGWNPNTFWSPFRISEPYNSLWEKSKELREKEREKNKE
jgi:hypothetical protein